MNERGRRLRSDPWAVSPVVGSILVLVIMIISIGGIMAWGVPAIKGLQDHAEYQAVLTQFLQMDSDVRGLRDPQNTRISTISISQGKIRFDDGDRWLVIGTTDSAYDSFRLSDWETGDPAQLTVLGPTIDADNEITVDSVSGGTFTLESSCPSALIPVCSSTIDLGAVLLSDDITRIQVFDNAAASVVAEAWIFNAGHLSYVLADSDGNNRLHFEMGAVFSQHTDFFYMEDSPTVKDPDYDIDPEDKSLFFRMLQLSGTVPQAVGGKGRFPIVYHLVDNYGFSRGRPSFDPATGVRVQIHGDLEVPFCNVFDEGETPGWRNEDLVSGAAADCPESGSDGDVNLFYDRSGEDLVYDLSHSVVTTTVRTP